MTRRTLLQRMSGIIFLLTLLTACGDGNGMNFTIERGNWPWPWPGNANAYANKSFSQSVPVTLQDSIRIDGINGEIEIIGQPGASAVMVAANLRVGSDSFVDAQAGLDQLAVLVTDGPDEISIQTLQPQSSQGRQYRVDYTLTVPSDLVVDLNHVNGHVSIAGFDNPVEVDVVNGNVLLSNLFGGATVSVENGSVDATLSLPPGGEASLATVNGNLLLRIPSSTSAGLSASVDHGVISWSNLNLLNVLETNLSLTGTLGGGDGAIHLETTNGDIEVTGFAG